MTTNNDSNKRTFKIVELSGEVQNLNDSVANTDTSYNTVTPNNISNNYTNNSSTNITPNPSPYNIHNTYGDSPYSIAEDQCGAISFSYSLGLDLGGIPICGRLSNISRHVIPPQPISLYNGSLHSTSYILRPGEEKLLNFEELGITKKLEVLFIQSECGNFTYSFDNNCWLRSKVLFIDNTEPLDCCPPNPEIKEQQQVLSITSDYSRYTNLIIRNYYPKNGIRTSLYCVKNIRVKVVIIGY